MVGMRSLRRCRASFLLVVGAGTGDGCVTRRMILLSFQVVSRRGRLDGFIYHVDGNLGGGRDQAAPLF